MKGRQSQQLSSLIRRAVQSVLDAGLADPRLDALITVTKVTVDSPPRVANVSVSVMPDKHESRVLHGLKDASRHIRRESGEILQLHMMPELQFRIDKSLKRQQSVFEALAKVREEESRGKKSSGWGGPAASDEDATAADDAASQDRESTS